MRIGKCVQAVAVIGTIAGCSLTLNADREQCKTTADCAQSGLGEGVTCVSNVCVAPSAITVDSGEDAAPPDPTWGCLGKMKFADPTPEIPLTYKVRFLKATSDIPLVGVQYAACNGLDLGCLTPVEGSVGVTDENGIMSVVLYKGFRGYFQLRGTGAAEIKPATLYFTPPDHDVDIRDFKAQVHLMTSAEFDYIVGLVGDSVGKDVDPEAGHVFGYAFDCQYRAAKGVSVTMNPVGTSTYSYYSGEGRVPSPTLQETTDYAEAGFINAPVGSVTLNYRLATTTQRIGTIAVSVRKGEVTYAPLEPSP